MTSMARRERVITSAPKKGQVMPVKVPTHVAGTLRFANGAIVQIAMSFDVAGHNHSPLEIYGTEASLLVPDPNNFGGEVKVRRPGGDWVDEAVTLPYADGNYRSLGVADMAHAILANRPHRASGDLALHVLEVMEAFDKSSRSGQVVEITTPLERPAPIGASLVDGRIA